MDDIKKIPPVILAKLEGSLSRIRRILFFRGVCATLAVLVASVLAIMAVDAMVTIYESWIRWVLWLAAMSGTGSVAWFALIAPLRRKITLTDVALLIERNHPELEERLSTVVELSAIGDTEVWSKELLDEITKAAVRDAGSVTPRKEFTGRTVKPRFIAAGAALVVLLLLFLAFPSVTWRLVARALVPSAEIDNIYASSMEVLPGDRVLLCGTPLALDLTVKGGYPSRAYVRTSVNGRREAVERMVRTSEENSQGPVRFGFSYPALTESFTYRIECGNALTRKFNVKVVPVPTYTDRKVIVRHPAYTGRAPDTNEKTGEIVGVAGSRVTVSVKKPRPDLIGAITIPGDRIIRGVDSGDDRMTFSFQLAKGGDGQWTAEMSDENGFSNKVESASIRVVPDAPPTVETTEPSSRELKLPRSGILSLGARAKDDFGIAACRLELCIGAGEWKIDRDIETYVDDEGWTVAGDTYSIRGLSSKLGKAATFQARYRFEDNLPEFLGGPNVTFSESVLVQIQTQARRGDSSSKSLGRKALEEQIKSTKEATADIRKQLAIAQDKMRVAAEHFPRSDVEWSLKTARNTLNESKGALANAEGLLEEMIEGMIDTKLETGAKIFRPILKDQITPCRQEAEDIFLVAGDKEKAQPCSVTHEHIVAAVKAYEEAVKRYSMFTKTAEDMQRLEDLAREEKALAESAKLGEMDAKELSAAEKELQEELEKFAQKELKPNSLDSELEKAKNLNKLADELAAKQDELRKKSEAARKDGGDNARNEVAGEERQLADALKKLAEETDRLRSDIEEKSGIPETDPSETSKPAANAGKSEHQAAENADKAAESLKNGDFDKARGEMDAVAKALADAKKSLADAEARIGKKNSEMAAQQKALEEMMNAVAEAQKAAQGAADAEAERQKSEGGENAEGRKGNGEQHPMSAEELKAMIDSMKSAAEQMQRDGAMTKEQFEAAMAQLKEMAASLGKMTPEAMKAQIDAQMKAWAKQQNEGQKGDKPQGEWEKGQQPQPGQQRQQPPEGQQQQPGQEQQQQQQQRQQGQQSPQMPMSPEQMMNQLQQKNQQQMSAMQNQLQQMQKQMNPASMQMQQKLSEAAKSMQDQLKDQLQQNNMPESPFDMDQPESDRPPDPNARSSKDHKVKKTKKLEKSKGPKGKIVGGDDLSSDGDWFKMKSASGSNAEADSMNDVPAEYRGLVRDYFKAVNSGERK